MNIELLGAEMLTATDAATAFGAPLLLQLLPDRGGRALVAGPVEPALVLELATRYDSVDVLVRSYPDAQELRAALPEAVRIHCGPISRFRGSFDVVIAVSGLDRLTSLEEPPVPDSDTLGALVGLVAPGGDLLVGIGNVAGLDRLLALEPTTDADWPAGVVTADPLLPHEVSTDLGPVATWHCHGRRHAPTLAAPDTLFSAPDAALIRETGRAARALLPAAKDPVAAARAFTRAGLGAAVAPLTILHLSRGPAPQPTLAMLLDGAAGSAFADELEACVAAYDLSSAGPLIRVRAEEVGADALAHELLDIAADLLARGARHPWSPASTARDLARHLGASMALDVDAVAGDYDTPGNATHRSYADLARLAEELGTRAAEADAHIVWLLQRMQSRQRMLREARGRIAELEAGARPSLVRRAVRKLRRRPPQPQGWTGAPNPDSENRDIEAEIVPPGYEPTTDAIRIVPTVTKLDDE